MCRRLAITLGLAAILALALGGSALAFPDVPDSHPYAQGIADLSSRGIIGGYLNGNFGPQDPVMRQQFAKMIVKTLDLTVTGSETCPFVDVEAGTGTDPFYPLNYVAVCAQNNITKGVDASHFNPSGNITRQQVITMVVRAVDNLKPGTLRDVSAGWLGLLPAGDPTHGANIKKAEYNGLLEGIWASASTAGLTGWDTTKNASRGEVAQLLHNVLTGGGGVGGPLTVYPVLSATRRVETTSQEDTKTILTATGPRGETYRLSLPAGALPDGITVAMTPLDRVGGFPFSGGLVAGVALEPDGLSPLMPGTLTITTPPALLTSGYLPTVFGYQGAGEEFYPRVALKEGSTFTLIISHFSGWGVGLATSAELTSLALTHSSSDDLSVKEWMETQDWPKKPPTLDPEEWLKWGQQELPLLLEWLRRCDSPSGYKMFDEAWVHTLIFLWLPWQPVSALDPLLEQVARCFVNCSEYARQNCLREGTICDLGRMYRWYFWAGIFTNFRKRASEPELDYVVDQFAGLRKYLTPAQVVTLGQNVIATGNFEVEIDSDIVYGGGWDIGYTVKARLDFLSLPLRNSLVNLTCEEHTGQLGQTLTITKATAEPPFAPDDPETFHVGQTQIESATTVRLDPQMWVWLVAPVIWEYRDIVPFPPILTIESTIVNFKDGRVWRPHDGGYHDYREIHGWQYLDGNYLNNPDGSFRYPAAASSQFLAQDGLEPDRYILIPDQDRFCHVPQLNNGKPYVDIHYELTEPYEDPSFGYAGAWTEDLRIRVFLNR